MQTDERRRKKKKTTYRDCLHPYRLMEAPSGLAGRVRGWNLVKARWLVRPPLTEPEPEPEPGAADTHAGGREEGGRSMRVTRRGNEPPVRT